MAVRVRLRLKTRKGKEELTVALVNSVFESDRLLEFFLSLSLLFGSFDYFSLIVNYMVFQLQWRLGLWGSTHWDSSYF
ncbi:MAG: hypothetical protein RXR39_03605 [Caldivirga sp.]